MIRARIVVLTVLAVSTCAPASAQTSTDAGSIPAVTATIDADVIRDLPTDDNIFSILETTQPSLISSQVGGGGAYTGQAPRIGGFFSSGTQTLYRLGDVSLSDPTGSGAPLLLPDPELWSHIGITTGMMPASMNAPGVAISLDPQLPAAKWTTTLAGTAGLPSGASRVPLATVPEALSLPMNLGPTVPIAAANGSARAVATGSGPLLTDDRGNTRLAGFFAGTWTHGSSIVREEANSLAATVGSGFAHLMFTPDDRNAIHAIGWVQRDTSPFDQRLTFRTPGATTTDNAADLQASWEHGAADGPRLRFFGGYTERTETLPALPPTPIADQLSDTPISALAFEAPGTVSRWTLGARLPAATGGAQSLDGGVEIGGARDKSSAYFQGLAGELLDGMPARIWSFNAPTAATSNRHDMTVAAYASDRITIAPGFVVTGGVRFDSVTGSADGAASRVRWQTWLPRASVEWTLPGASKPKIFAGVTRTAYLLPLDLLAVGDPGAPTAQVFQWLNTNGQVTPTSAGALIANVGPGSGGNPSFAQIDSNLQRPTTDELAIGIEAHPSAALRLALTGFLRRENHLLALVDIGTPATAFTLSGQADPGLLLQNPIDDQVLPVYNRTVSSFGQDRYLLTNPDEPAATSETLEISAELKTKRVIFSGGATANESNGNAAAIGFGPDANEPDILGNVFVDPNAATFARGRLFTDRAFTIKLATVLRLPDDIHVGVVARYQDGQPFSRIVVVPGLNQGPTAIRAFPDGESRFTFTETLDARAQKRFPIGNDSLDVVLDVFNLLNTKNEVEEQTVSGADFRAPTAIQPPRAFQVGFRIEF